MYKYFWTVPKQASKVLVFEAVNLFNLVMLQRQWIGWAKGITLILSPCRKKKPFQYCISQQKAAIKDLRFQQMKSLCFNIRLGTFFGLILKIYLGSYLFRILELSETEELFPVREKMLIC